MKLLTGSLLDVNVNGVLRDDGRWETPARRWAAGRVLTSFTGAESKPKDPWRWGHQGGASYRQGTG